MKSHPPHPFLFLTFAGHAQTALSAHGLPALFLFAVTVACSTPGQRRELSDSESPLLPVEARDANPVQLPRALPLEGSGGAGGIFFPSQRADRKSVKTTVPEGPAESDTTAAREAEAERNHLIQELYARFREDAKIGNPLDVPTLNDLALYATTVDDEEGAEALFRLALTKEDSLPLRLNLAFLTMRKGNSREAVSMLDAVREHLREDRKAAVVRELFARHFEEAAVGFVEAWFRESEKEISPPLVESVKIAGAYFEARGQTEDAKRIYLLLDIRGKADGEALFGLARNLPPAEARTVYRRILALPPKAFAPDSAPPDDAFRRYAGLCAQQFEFAEAERSLARLRSPRYEDLKARVLARLRMDPDANVEPLIQTAAKIPPEGLRPLSAFLFAADEPAHAPSAAVEREGGFPALMRGAFESIRPVLLPAELRSDVFGTTDPAQADRDRRALKQLL